MSGARRHCPEVVMELARDISKEPNTEDTKKQQNKHDMGAPFEDLGS